MIRLRLSSGEQGCEGKKLKGFEDPVCLREKQFLRDHLSIVYMFNTQLPVLNIQFLKPPQLSIEN